MPDLADGESIEMKGSGSKPYVIKNVGGLYSCTCPAWRNQSLPIERRTCKHIRKLRGDPAEEARLGSPPPPRAPVNAPKEGPPVLLAETWDTEADLTGWWMSEKLDGVRAYWDGQQFWSRLGNTFVAPDWFVEGLPAVPLDGELWIGRKAFQRTVGIVRRHDRPKEWGEVRFVAFDAPAHGGAFEVRLRYLDDLLRRAGARFVQGLEHKACRGIDHLRAELDRVEQLGGEGLMLRQPGSLYCAGRSATLLKVKRFLDAEAVVVGLEPGKGKHKGKMGALSVKLPDGTLFSLGTGFSDAERANPPGLGAVVTFRYQELSDGGVPRFPSFVRVRADADITRVVEVSDAAVRRRKAEEKQATPVPAKPASPSGGKRHFEFVEGKSSKFWEVWVTGARLSTRYGRIGAEGTTTVKDYPDEAAAVKAMDKVVAEKTGKGYEEKTP
ncbi:MAG: DNA ligase [Gemmataceae bacterium]